jgi:hypothetical protein
MGILCQPILPDELLAAEPQQRTMALSAGSTLDATAAGIMLLQPGVKSAETLTGSRQASLTASNTCCCRRVGDGQ